MNMPKIPSAECVVLLHGLARSHLSMHKMSGFLRAAGYCVVNQHYPSTRYKIEYLAEHYIPIALARCRKSRMDKIHFVTHSMGGILLRQYLSQHDIPELGRVVMLAPPNQGSEVVDKLGQYGLFRWFNGPAGQQLGTDSHSVPGQLPDADFELGIIAGKRSVNFFLSRLIPGANDGKVAVSRTSLKGQKDFMVVAKTHPFIMRSRNVMQQTVHFLRHACFKKN